MKWVDHKYYPFKNEYVTVTTWSNWRFSGAVKEYGKKTSDIKRILYL